MGSPPHPRISKMLLQIPSLNVRANCKHLLRLAEISQEQTRTQRWARMRAIGQTQKPAVCPERQPRNSSAESAPATMMLPQNHARSQQLLLKSVPTGFYGPKTCCLCLFQWSCSYGWSEQRSMLFAQSHPFPLQHRGELTHSSSVSNI